MKVTEEQLRTAAKAAYEFWVAPVQCCEPAWKELPESHQDRLIEAQRVAFEAVE